MNSPGVYDLADQAITAAAIYVGSWITGLDGMLAVTTQFRFQYGSGGSSAKAYLQTSLDGGTTAIDIASVVFGQAGETDIINLSGLTPRTTQIVPTDGALADDTVVDGVLGDRLRIKIITTGIYAASTVLSVRSSVR